jgi:dihydroflavonol-4-reductase
MIKKEKVLVTGISGFVGSHVAIQLLDKGYQVIGTLRSMQRAGSINEIIGQNTRNIENLSFEEADLMDEKVWLKITEGVDYVMHVASPFPTFVPEDENEIIKPAFEGTLNVLKGAHANGVKKVVLTSSIAAIVYGKDPDKRNGTFNESYWTNPENKLDSTPYIRSKALAEKAAWEFANKNGLKLSAICPGGILGPVLEEDISTSVNLVSKMLDGQVPGLPKIGIEIIDVRSVADLHIRAMESPHADGERFACTAGFLMFKDIADILKEHYPDRKIPQIVLPNFLVRLFSFIDKSVRQILLDLGIKRQVDCSKAEKLLGWSPLTPKEAVISCAETYIRFKEAKRKKSNR